MHGVILARKKTRIKWVKEILREGKKNKKREGKKERD